MNGGQQLGSLALTPPRLAPLMQGVCLRPSKIPVTNVQIDSRLCEAGSLFFALSGTQRDGFSFIVDAERRGAAAVVVPLIRAEEARLLVQVSIIAVADVLTALHRLAASYVQTVSRATLVGITGSVGKTTTKEALAAILSSAGPTAKTPGNFNSEYGLPLSVFTLSPHDRYGVFELGIDHIGVMERLVSILRPSHALLTNIGISHLEKFKSVHTTAVEKAKIFHPTLQAGFISSRCSHLPLIEAASPRPLQRYHSGDVEAIDLGLDGWRLTWRGRAFTVRTVGRHLLEDVVGAITVADSLGIEAKTIAQALEGFETMGGRTSVQNGAITIIDDSYNASWDSTSSILSYLSTLSWQGAKKVVLGPMKELGAASRRAHRGVAQILASSSFSQAHLYGAEMKTAKDELVRLGYRGAVTWTEDFEELGSQVEETIERGDLVLLKASRSVAIDRLIPTLQARGHRYA